MTGIADPSVKIKTSSFSCQHILDSAIYQVSSGYMKV